MFRFSYLPFCEDVQSLETEQYKGSDKQKQQLLFDSPSPDCALYAHILHEQLFAGVHYLEFIVRMIMLFMNFDLRVWHPLLCTVQYSVSSRTRKCLTKDEKFWTFAHLLLKWNRMIPKIAQDVDAASSYTWTKERRRRRKRDFRRPQVPYVNDRFCAY